MFPHPCSNSLKACLALILFYFFSNASSALINSGLIVTLSQQAGRPNKALAGYEKRLEITITHNWQVE